MKKIGIMGGTFNPIHNGHIALAQAAFDYCGLDEVWFMPSGVSYLKQNDKVAPGEVRLEMTKLAIEGLVGFECSDLEVKREGNTYTADTLGILNQMYPDYEFYFIMGADSLFGLPKWKEPEKIAALCTLAAVVRDDVDQQALQSQEKLLERTLDAHIILIPFHKVDISSSKIREMLAKGEDVEEMVPTKVLSYIRQNQLYKEELACGRP